MNLKVVYVYITAVVSFHTVDVVTLEIKMQLRKRKYEYM